MDGFFLYISTKKKYLPSQVVHGSHLLVVMMMMMMMMVVMDESTYSPPYAPSWTEIQGPLGYQI